MLAHAGGAAALDLPAWLLAYLAAAAVVSVAAAWRGRILLVPAGSGRPRRRPAGRGLRGTRLRGTRAGRARPGGTRAGGALGVAALGLVLAAAFAGPDRPAANLAPSAVLAVWWVGLPLACALAGDVMRWIDPFAPLARPVARLRRRPRGGAAPPPAPDGGRAPVWPAAALLGAFAWWDLAYHGARSPRSLGWFLAAYTALAVAGGAVQATRRIRWTEAFGALSAGLGAARTGGAGAGPGARDPEVPAGGVAALAAVWLGATAFDLFAGTRAWVDLAGAASGWARTGRATIALAAATLLAGAAIAASCRAAGGRWWPGAGAAAPGDPPVATQAPPPQLAIERAVALAWLATTAGAFLAHGLTRLLVEGQVALALASDPFGRGWDLFGTAARSIDHSPFSPGAVGTAQLAVTIGGAAWGVVAAARRLHPAATAAEAGPRAALRALWAIGVALAVLAALAVLVLASDLE